MLAKIQGLFKTLSWNSRTFQGFLAFKDFWRTYSKIQGLFKTVRTLWTHTLRRESPSNFLDKSGWKRKELASSFPTHLGKIEATLLVGYWTQQREKFPAWIILKFLVTLDRLKWSFARSKFDSKQSPIFLNSYKLTCNLWFNLTVKCCLIEKSHVEF